jgi:UDP-2,3-diacylglucosamine pyrophosphatase LpxH
MYKKYIFNIDPKNVWVVGDGHGEWGLLKYKIKESGIKDGVIIMAGDCGFGFEKEGFYKLEYDKVKRLLKEQNITIVFVRGNHDDPDYFDGEKINFDYWKAVPDYSILSFSSTGEENDDKHNVLCVGGAISIDRRYRIDSDYQRWMYHKSDKKSYWYNEMPIYKPEILDKIKEDGIEIRTIVTHSSPSFAPLTDKHGIESFIRHDKELVEDIANERLVMTQVYDHLVKKHNHPLKLIVHGHFHQHSLFYSDENVKIIMLDCMGTKNNSWDIYPIER